MRWPPPAEGLTSASGAAMGHEKYTPTWAQRFVDRVWAAPPGELTSVEMLILLAYARHARRGDSAWVTQRRLMDQCKVVSMSTLVAARRAVVKKGWLEPIGTVSLRGGKATVYRLCLPFGDMTDVSPGGESDTATVSLSSESDTERVSLADASDTERVSLSPGKRYTVHSEAIQLKRSSDTAAVSGPLDSASPGGGMHAGARADAGARERTREAATLRAASNNPASTDERSARAEALASMRETAERAERWYRT